VQKRLTAEFGMGSGLVTSQMPPGRRRAEKTQTGLPSKAISGGRGFHDRWLRPCPEAREHGHRLMRAFKPIELLVPVRCTHCCASTPGLSTWSSSTALKGELVLRPVSRLDAFSGYPFRT